MDTAQKARHITLETQTCRRCGGTGHYSYNSRTGTRCFGCSGSGTTLTRRGKAASKALAAYLDDHSTVAASSLVAGDRIRGRSGRWVRVHEVTVDLSPRWRGGCKIGAGDDLTEWCTLGQTVYVTRTSAGTEIGNSVPAHSSVVRYPTPDVWEGYFVLAERLAGATVTGGDDDNDG